MKRILYILLAVCLIFSLAACGSKSAKNSPNRADKDAEKAVENILEDVEDIDTEEEAEDFVEGLTGWDIEQDGDEYTIKTGDGEDGGEITFRTGDDIVWDSDKVGGLPQPEGTTLYMEADMTSLFGQEFSYSYSVNGLKKDVYLKYAELVKDRYPSLIMEANTDTECTLMTMSEDGNETILVTFLEDGLSIVQYMR